MNDFLRSVPAAASSPYALVAYAIAAILFLFAGARLKMARMLLARIETVPPEERRRALEIAAGTILPAQISPTQWIRLKRLQWRFVLLGAVLIALLAVATVALVSPVPHIQGQLKAIEGVTTTTAKETQRRIEAVDSHITDSVQDSTKTIVGAVQDTALANLETMFPLAVRIDRDVDGTIMHLDGSPRQRLISYDQNMAPMKLHWGDRFHYFVFTEGGRNTTTLAAGTVFLEVGAGARKTRLPLVLDPFSEHEIRIPGSSPEPMDAFLINEDGISGVSIKITVYSADRERGRAEFRTALLNTSLSAAARRTYLTVSVDGARLRSGGSATARVLRTLRKGTYVRVKDRAEDWCHIRLPEGREGWLQCTLLIPIS